MVPGIRPWLCHKTSYFWITKSGTSHERKRRAINQFLYSFQRFQRIEQKLLDSTHRLINTTVWNNDIKEEFAFNKRRHRCSSVRFAWLIAFKWLSSQGRFKKCSFYYDQDLFKACLGAEKLASLAINDVEILMGETASETPALDKHSFNSTTYLDTIFAERLPHKKRKQD